MADTALIIGGSGQVGRAAAASLVADGWAVTAVQRSAADLGPGVTCVAADRNSAEMEALLAGGHDVVIDLRAFTPEHSAQLLRHAGSIGSLVFLSSAAVYCDAEGRVIEDGLKGGDWPRYEGLIPETGPAVAPDDATYAGRKRAIEETLLASTIPTTVLRPAGISGPYSSQAREWFYIRRLLDGRDRFVLGFGGRGSLHPVSVENLAEMMLLSARTPGDRILNAGDPNAPVERDIAAAIARAMGRDVTICDLAGPPPVASPWSLPAACLLDMKAAECAIGYAPVITYEEAVRGTCDWILDLHAQGAFESRLSPMFGPAGLGVQVFAGESQNPFDYDAEDRAWEETDRPRTSVHATRRG